MNSLKPYKKRILFILSINLLVILMACQKNKVNRKHSEMIGDWYHYTGINLYFSISIFENGRGYIYEKTTNYDGLDTQGRAWLIKDNKLIFSRFKREQFFINSYPMVATDKIISEFDTIQIGQTFMILDGQYFVKK